jgi:LacI family transcriptional regulator
VHIGAWLSAKQRSQTGAEMVLNKPQDVRTMSSKPTIRDIAQAAGVHHATVSRVLNNHPRISAPTRQRVQETVHRLGYRPHPLVSTLMGHRSKRRKTLPEAGMALLLANRRLAASSSHVRRDGQAIHQRAAESGFFVEVYHLDEYTHRPQRLSTAWRARGIVGVLVDLDTVGDPCLPADLDLTGFACASLGTGIAGLHTAQADHYAGMLRAWKEIRRLGYRRPGLYLHAHIDSLTQSRWTAAYLLMQQELPPTDRIPVFIGGSTRDRSSWAKLHRPDVIINNSFRQDMAHIDTVVLDAIRSEDTGIDQQRALIASTAVDLIAAQLSRNETGLTTDPLRILVPGRWVEGNTCGGVSGRAT